MTQTYSQEQFIRLQPKGLITIPKKMRDRLGFKTSGLIRIRETVNLLTLEPVGVVSYPVRRYTNAEVDAFIKLDTQETKKLTKSQLTVK